MNAGKTIAIWTVLIAMFVAIYSMMKDGKDGSSTAPLIALVVMISVPVIMFVVLMTMNIRRGRRFVRDQHLALAALHQGELEKAKTMFAGWSESPLARVAALSRHNLAWTLMRQAEFSHAIEMARHALSRYPLELQAMTMFPTTMVDLALMHALAGDVAAAKQVMTELEQRKGLTNNSSFPAMQVFATAVIACRDGRVADAAHMLDENWARCESVMTGDVLRPLRAIRAFAIASADARDAGKAELQLVNARPAFAGEYDFLGKAWPEMQAFLVTHELATSSGPST